jgi:hypothetical protein
MTVVFEIRADMNAKDASTIASVNKLIEGLRNVALLALSLRVIYCDPKLPERRLSCAKHPVQARCFGEWMRPQLECWQSVVQYARGPIPH